MLCVLWRPSFHLFFRDPTLNLNHRLTTNSAKQNPLLEANSHHSSYKINAECHYGAHNSPPQCCDIHNMLPLTVNCSSYPV
jgi:hypothetical protein